MDIYTERGQLRGAGGWVYRLDRVAARGQERSGDGEIQGEHGRVDTGSKDVREDSGRIQGVAIQAAHARIRAISPARDEVPQVHPEERAPQRRVPAAHHQAAGRRGRNRARVGGRHVHDSAIPQGRLPRRYRDQ